MSLNLWYIPKGSTRIPDKTAISSAHQGTDHVWVISSAVLVVFASKVAKRLSVSFLDILVDTFVLLFSLPS